MDFDAKKTILVSFFSVWCFTTSWGQAADTSWDLSPAAHPTTVRVKTVVEAAGSLWVNEPQQKLPLQVKAEMLFEERDLAREDGAIARHYWKAKADLEVARKPQQRTLREERQLILLAGDSLTDRITSPSGSLTRDELDLLDVAGNTHPIDSLLPGKRVRLSESWQHDEETVRQLLRIEEVEETSLSSKLAKVAAGKARVEIKGKVRGKTHGAAATMEVVGSFQYDITRQQIVWLALSIKERRERSPATPGFEVVSRIQSARQPTASPQLLTEKVLAGIPPQVAEGDKMLELVADNNLYRIALDRRWHLVQNHATKAELRLVDAGTLLASCKVERLNRMAAGTEMTLFGFQQDVVRALDKFCDQVVASSESVNPHGLKVLRVEAMGEVEKTPVRWVYYHLENRTGYRLSTIFTYEASLIDQVAGLDEVFIGNLEMLPPGAIEQAQAETASQQK